MRKLLSMVAVCLLALTGRARAGVMGDERIELRPPTVTVESLEPSEANSAAGRFLPPLPAERVPTNVFRAYQASDMSGPIRLELPEMGPEGLDLEVRAGRFLFKVGADMVDGRTRVVWSPRLDCDTRETYFWCRLSCDVTDQLSVYCESFQAAGAILGTDTTHATQGYVWDGYQLQLGMRFELNDRVSLEGGPVFYVLSATQKPSSIGGRVGLSVSF